MENPLVLVVGAAGTLGRELCREFLQANWRVVGFSRNPDIVYRLVGRQGIVLFQADCVDSASLKRAFATAESELVGCKGAVNCAGNTIRRPLHELSVSEFRRVQYVNVESTFVAMQREYLLMKKDGGVILNIGSLASLRANRWQESAYVAAKHSLLGLTKAAAVEFGADKVRVNLVAPSVFIASSDKEGGEANSFSIPDSQALAAKSPLRQLPTVAEVARVVSWLIRECPACVTGITFRVDAGLSCT